MSVEAPNLVAGEERPPATGTWLDKSRPADGTPLRPQYVARYRVRLRSADFEIE